MSGGSPSAGQSVEVYVPSTGLQCKLPDLPDVRYGHTMEAKTVCGGLKSDDTKTSCITLNLTSAGTWKETINLLEKR